MIYLISSATFVTHTLCFKFVLSLIDPILGLDYVINLRKFSKKFFFHTFDKFDPKIAVFTYKCFHNHSNDQCI